MDELNQNSKDKSFTQSDVKEEIPSDPLRAKTPAATSDGMTNSADSSSYENEHLYYSPGEPLTPRDNPKAPDKNTNSVEPYHETPEGEVSPHFSNVRITGTDAQRIISEAAKSDLKLDMNTGTADRSLFANVSLNAGTTATPEDLSDLSSQTPLSGSNDNLARPADLSSDTQASAQAPSLSPENLYKDENTLANSAAFTATDAPGSYVPHYAGHKNSADKSPSAASKALLYAFLYVRQLAASFFTHTILGIIFPRAGNLLGPCYPSSMPIPFFVMGFVTMLPVIYLPSCMHVTLGFCGAIATALFVIMDGVAGFRGISSFISAISRTRTAGSYEGAVSATCLTLIWACLSELGDIIPSGAILAPAVGAVFMLSALTACTLSFGVEPDPVDSYGTMSFKGLLFALAITLITLYLCLPPLAATSFFGLALLLRLIIGHYMLCRGMFPSRDLVNAMQMFSLNLLLIYMTVVSALRIF